jgi:hypothetical protein
VSANWTTGHPPVSQRLKLTSRPISPDPEFSEENIRFPLCELR